MKQLALAEEYKLFVEHKNKVIQKDFSENVIEKSEKINLTKYIDLDTVNEILEKKEELIQLGQISYEEFEIKYNDFKKNKLLYIYYCYINNIEYEYNNFEQLAYKIYFKNNDTSNDHIQQIQLNVIKLEKISYLYNYFYDKENKKEIINYLNTLNVNEQNTTLKEKILLNKIGYSKFKLDKNKEYEYKELEIEIDKIIYEKYQNILAILYLIEKEKLLELNQFLEKILKKEQKKDIKTYLKIPKNEKIKKILKNKNIFIKKIANLRIIQGNKGVFNKYSSLQKNGNLSENIDKIFENFIKKIIKK